MELPYNTSIPRLEKAIRLIDNVCIVSPGKFYVQSESKPDKFYEIYDEKLTCECEDSSYNDAICWHVRAVQLFKSRNITPE